MKQKYFYLDESPIFKERYVLRRNFELFKNIHNSTQGSYGVWPARLLKLSYADYLRYCRDRLGADLIGKRSRYVTPYFLDNEETRKFVEFLNRTMEYVDSFITDQAIYKEENGKIIRTEINGTDE